MTQPEADSSVAKAEIKRHFEEAFAARSFANSLSFLARVSQRLYDENAVSSDEHTKEGAGMMAVIGFLERVEQCVEKEISPQRIYSRFTASEKRAMLAEINMEDISADKAEGYHAVKASIGTRNKWLATLAGATLTGVIGLGALLRADDSGERSVERAALKHQVHQADASREAAIESVLQTPSDSQAADALSQSHQALKEAKRKLEVCVDESQSLFPFILGGAYGILVVPLIGATRSIFNTKLSRLQLEGYREDQVGALGMGATLNEQLIDKELSIQVQKFGESLDDFMRKIVVANAQQQKHTGIQ